VRSLRLRIRHVFAGMILDGLGRRDDEAVVFDPRIGRLLRRIEAEE